MSTTTQSQKSSRGFVQTRVFFAVIILTALGAIIGGYYFSRYSENVTEPLSTAISTEEKLLVSGEIKNNESGLSFADKIRPVEKNTDGFVADTEQPKKNRYFRFE